jgi:hypothetical protein
MLNRELFNATQAEFNEQRYCHRVAGWLMRSVSSRSLDGNKQHWTNQISRADLQTDLHRQPAKVAFATLYNCKTQITAADLLNAGVLPFFQECDVKLLRVLTDLR